MIWKLSNLKNKERINTRLFGVIWSQFVLMLIQGKLNEIWVVVPLEMKQLDFQDVINPEDIPSAKGLVVPNKTIERSFVKANAHSRAK